MMNARTPFAFLVGCLMACGEPSEAPPSRGRSAPPAADTAQRAVVEEAPVPAASREDAEGLLRLLVNLPSDWSADRLTGSLAMNCTRFPFCRPREASCREVLGLCPTARQEFCDVGLREDCAVWTGGGSLLETIRARYTRGVESSRAALSTDAERSRLDATWTAIDRRLRAR